MSDARHERLSDLFTRAREMHGSERSAFLDDACAGDAALREELDAMLAFDAERPDFLASPAVAAAGALSAFGTESANVLPTQIGRYRVLRKLGEGGMGVVFAAEQDAPKRVVAIKVLRTAFASDEALRRFAQEAEVLGRLQHPCIAQVYEAGVTTTADGARVPFLAMEYVEGMHLRQAFEQGKVPLRERLRTIIELATAIDHAHRKGVIHRDLKSANVLLCPDGRPRVLDFGIARVVGDDAESLRTRTGSIIGTLESMSPEQAAGAAADTRSDVYALGVILFEASTDRPPRSLQGLSLADALRSIQNDDAPRLRSVWPDAPIDLDVVVSRALERDPEARYPTVAALAEDLRRFLEDEPILARPTSNYERVRKFVRRHRLPVALTTAVFVTLAAGLIGTWLQWRESEHRREEAEAARRDEKVARDAEQAVSDFLLQDVLRSPDPSRDGRFVRVVDVLDRAAKDAASRFKGRPELEASLCASLAASFRALGIPDRADLLSARALELFEQVFGAEHERTITSMFARIELLLGLDRLADAEPLLMRARSICERLRGRDSDAFWTAEHYRAQLLFLSDRLDDALALQRDVLAQTIARHGENSDAVIGIRNNLSVMLLRRGEFDEAETLAQQVLDARTAMSGPDHPETLFAARNLAQLLEDRRRLVDAENVWRDLVTRAERTFGKDHPTTLDPRLGLATATAARGGIEDARREFEAVLAIRQRLYGPTNLETLRALRGVVRFELDFGVPESAKRRGEELVAAWRATGRGDDPDFADALNTYGRACRGVDDFDGAIAAFREALTVYERLYSTPIPPMAVTLFNLGITLRDHREFAAAASMLQRALDADLKLYGEGYTNVLTSRSGLARAYLMDQRYEDAEAAARANLEQRTTKPDADPRSLRRDRATLGLALFGQARHEEALVELSAAYEAYEGAKGGMDASTVELREGLARNLEALGRHEEAASVRAHASAAPPKG
jgi:tetratricopeptide (TPR) repeat protein/predicted Ser/Thr protein kinase